MYHLILLPVVCVCVSYFRHVKKATRLQNAHINIPKYAHMHSCKHKFTHMQIFDLQLLIFPLRQTYARLRLAVVFFKTRTHTHKDTQRVYLDDTQVHPLHTQPRNLSDIALSGVCVCVCQLTPRLQSTESRCQCTTQHFPHTHTCMFMTLCWRDDRQAALQEDILPCFCCAECLWCCSMK